MFSLQPLMISGREVLPLIEGGKGVSVSNGESSGAWAKAGGVGTFSGVNADHLDENGQVVRQVYRGKTRRERHGELIAYAIKGAVHQARVAREIGGAKGGPVGDVGPGAEGPRLGGGDQDASDAAVPLYRVKMRGELRQHPFGKGVELGGVVEPQLGDLATAFQMHAAHGDHPIGPGERSDFGSTFASGASVTRP